MHWNVTVTRTALTYICMCTYERKSIIWAKYAIGRVKTITSADEDLRGRNGSGFYSSCCVFCSYNWLLLLYRPIVAYTLKSVARSLYNIILLTCWRNNEPLQHHVYVCTCTVSATWEKQVLRCYWSTIAYLEHDVAKMSTMATVLSTLHMTLHTWTVREWWNCPSNLSCSAEAVSPCHMLLNLHGDNAECISMKCGSTLVLNKKGFQRDA